jgi:hypothetical protein
MTTIHEGGKQSRMLTEHETKLEFIALACRLQQKAFDLMKEPIADAREIDLFQRAAVAIYTMTERLFGPIDIGDDDTAA